MGGQELSQGQEGLGMDWGGVWTGRECTGRIMEGPGMYWGDGGAGNVPGGFMNGAGTYRRRLSRDRARFGGGYRGVGHVPAGVKERPGTAKAPIPHSPGSNRRHAGRRHRCHAAARGDDVRGGAGGT